MFHDSALFYETFNGTEIESPNGLLARGCVVDGVTGVYYVAAATVGMGASGGCVGMGASGDCVASLFLLVKSSHVMYDGD